MSDGVTYVRTVAEPEAAAAPPIYLVTVLHLRDALEDIKRSRTWGWFARRDDAERAVLANATDMFEAGYYTHAVVEERPPGILVRATREDWYRATYAPGADMGDDPSVAPCAKPEWLSHTINFGMG